MNATAGIMMLGAEATVKGSLSRMAAAFASTKFRLNKNIDLPHFSMHGSFNAKTKAVPHVNVSWYDKAMNQPFMLSHPTIFGAGESGDEVVYGHKQLMSDIREAVGEGDRRPITINVYPSEGMDERELADRISERLYAEVKRKGAVFA